MASDKPPRRLSWRGGKLGSLSIPLTPSGSIHSLPETPIPSRPSTPKRYSSSSILTTPIDEQNLDTPHSQSQSIPSNNVERTPSAQPPTPLPASSSKGPEVPPRSSGSFGKMAFNSMVSALSLTRTVTGDEKDRGRSRESASNIKSPRSSSSAMASGQDERSLSRARARSQSPFTLRRFRSREPSPTPQALPLGPETDGSEERIRMQPRSTAFSDDDSETEPNTEDEGDESEWSDGEDGFDPVTERNTERNALIAAGPLTAADPEAMLAEDADADPLGEGVNVVVPPEPYFPSTLNHARTGTGGSRKGKGGMRRKKSKHVEPLPCVTSRPIFQRDRCTISVVQGDPEAARGNRRPRRYVVASDLSEESRYAVEWGIGTVLRDGDEMILVTVVENEAKVDPSSAAVDRTTKLRSQQERQGLSYILVRQATSLLQRTRLNVKVICQAWHAKNSRHMLLDIIDYNEPQMLIVGSRGLGQLKGILLGSTSHYLIQRCSVPVMVARRRLKRPPKRSAHLSENRTHVSLAEAGIDRVAPRVDEDVAVMRDQIQRDDDRRDGGMDEADARRVEEERDGEADEEGDEGEPEVEEKFGQKVAGN
ncbi:hypothetical protein PLICRDRAFT_39525 [Plicaturopsis crispa FD-325 SS-3]|nr:hypothetical protein PLICRDRAFT_39525 [Plicaturopsis crispa FD-325 SS-3]